MTEPAHDAEHDDARDQALREALMLGVNPYDEARIGLIMSAVINVNAGVHNAGMVENRMARLEQLMRDPNVRIMAEIAQRHHLPLSEVYQRWTEDDITTEVALLALHDFEASERCPECSVAEGDMFRNGREIAEPRYKVEWYSCPVCAEMAEFRQLAEDAEKRKPEGAPKETGYYRLVPRRLGESTAEIQDAHARSHTR